MSVRGMFAAAFGFAFVAAWIGFGFGDALLCLLGAAAAWVVVGVLDGGLDLGALQARISPDDDEPATPMSAAKPKRSRSRSLK